MKNALELPTALSPEVQQRIVALLAEGNYLSTACGAAGITYHTFRWWQRRWQEGDPDAQRFDEFFRVVDVASKAAESNALGRIRTGEPNWQANAWFLERRFPQRWGRQERQALPVKPPKPLDQMTDDELARYREQVEAARSRS
jgi:transposase